MKKLVSVGLASVLAALTLSVGTASAAPAGEATLVVKAPKLTKVLGKRTATPVVKAVVRAYWGGAWVNRYGTSYIKYHTRLGKFRLRYKYSFNNGRRWGWVTVWRSHLRKNNEVVVHITGRKSDARYYVVALAG